MNTFCFNEWTSVPASAARASRKASFCGRRAVTVNNYGKHSVVIKTLLTKAIDKHSTLVLPLVSWFKTVPRSQAKFGHWLRWLPSLPVHPTRWLSSFRSALWNGLPKVLCQFAHTPNPLLNFTYPPLALPSATFHSWLKTEPLKLSYPGSTPAPPHVRHHHCMQP